MPRITYPLTTPQEETIAREAISILYSAQQYDDLRITFTDDRQPQFDIRRRGYQYPHLKAAVDTVTALLNQGRLTVTGDAPRNYRIEIATHTAVSQYPVAHMDEQEEQSFNESVQAVNDAMRQGYCLFESHLDQYANIIFRYSIPDHAPDPDDTHGHIRTIIDAVNAGKAVRVELPDGPVMLMPRWKLN